jgi:rubrerythrin
MTITPPSNETDEQVGLDTDRHLERHAERHRRLAATAAGRQHLLRIAVDAEEGDEGGVFDLLATMVDEPRLQRLVTRHRDDEIRHAALYRGCLERNGFTMEHVPDELRLIPAIARQSNTLDELATGLDDPRRFIVRIYALLHAIEERGVEQFPLIAEAFRPADPETAEVYLTVTADERRHLRHCATIGRHYALDDDDWDAALARARRVEADAFEAIAQAGEDHAVATGLI